MFLRDHAEIYSSGHLGDRKQGTALWRKEVKNRMCVGDEIYMNYHWDTDSEEVSQTYALFQQEFVFTTLENYKHAW